MSKPKKRIRQKKRSRPPAPHSDPRNACLDTLRGLAIFLMIVDHVAWLLFHQPIAPDSIRIATRLSMPLFCVLTGYFAIGRKEANWERIIQVAVAALVVNLAYAALYTDYQRAEILASLLICYLVIAGVGRWFVVAVAAFLFYPVDMTEGFLDFPISVVASSVAVGGLLRLNGERVAMLVSSAICAGLAVGRLVQGGFHVVPPPTTYVLLFLPVATALIAAGIHYPALRVRWLEWIGL